MALRVLQVIPSLAARTGGAAEAVVQSSRVLQELGLETTIFSTDLGTPVSAAELARVGAGGLPAGANELDIRLFPTRFPRQLAYSPELSRALAAETRRYDVVHIHSLFLFPQLAAYRQATRQRVPYVVTLHGILDPYHRQHGRLRKVVTDALWQRRLLQGASVIHLTAEGESKLVDDVAPGVRRFVAPIGVHWREFQDLPDGAGFRRHYVDGYDGPLVMHLGRVSHKKAPEVLVQAFAHVARRVPDAKLAFVGPDDEQRTPSLAALAAELGIASKVVFTGMVPGEDGKRAALAAADVWALPSNAENFGIAVVEALAAGLPVVISPNVNIGPEIAEAGAAIVCEQAPEVFGAELARLLADEERRQALGAKAREFARRYDWRAVTPRLAEMYELVAAGNGRRA